jgi:hypothetical protein
MPLNKTSAASFARTRPPTNRKWSENSKISIVWKQQVADEQGDEGGRQHRYGDDEQIVAEERTPIRFSRYSSRQRLVPADEYPCQHKSRAKQPAKTAKQHARQGVGAHLREDAEIEHRAEEMCAEPVLGAIG